MRDTLSFPAPARSISCAARNFLRHPALPPPPPCPAEQLGVSRKEKVTPILVSPLRAPEVPARWDVRVGAKKGNAGLGGHSERVIFSMGGTRGRNVPQADTALALYAYTETLEQL